MLKELICRSIATYPAVEIPMCIYVYVPTKLNPPQPAEGAYREFCQSATSSQSE